MYCSLRSCPALPASTTWLILVDRRGGLRSAPGRRDSLRLSPHQEVEVLRLEAVHPKPFPAPSGSQVSQGAPARRHASTAGERRPRHSAPSKRWQMPNNRATRPQDHPPYTHRAALLRRHAGIPGRSRHLFSRHLFSFPSRVYKSSAFTVPLPVCRPGDCSPQPGQHSDAAAHPAWRTLPEFMQACARP